MSAKICCLELFCGIGGFAAACRDPFHVVHAIDIDRAAIEVYRNHFKHPTSVLTLESIRPEQLSDYGADLFWLSPPCQPFTQRGLQRDLLDPRSQALQHLIQCIQQVRPPFVAMENVPPFQKSQAAKLLRESLHASGYRFHEYLLCPTTLGIQNRRLRYYLIGARDRRLIQFKQVDGTNQLTSDQHTFSKSPSTDSSRVVRRVSDVLDESNWEDPTLRVPENVWQKYGNAMSRINPLEDDAIAACFTSAYHRSPVRSGSVLIREGQARYFCPREIVRMLGFDISFDFPAGMPRETCWGLAGNSLSVDVVRLLLQTISTPH